MKNNITNFLIYFTFLLMISNTHASLCVVESYDQENLILTKPWGSTSSFVVNFPQESEDVIRIRMSHMHPGKWVNVTFNYDQEQNRRVIMMRDNLSFGYPVWAQHPLIGLVSLWYEPNIQPDSTVFCSQIHDGLLLDEDLIQNGSKKVIGHNCLLPFSIVQPRQNPHHLASLSISLPSDHFNVVDFFYEADFENEKANCWFRTLNPHSTPFFIDITPMSWHQHGNWPWHGSGSADTE